MKKEQVKRVRKTGSYKKKMTSDFHFKKWIGIDPGKSGGICIISGTNMTAMKCPLTVHGMADIIRDIKEIEHNIPIICCIEKNHSMPKQGVKCMFTFGENYGIWQGILATVKVPYDLVPPQRWMKHYGSMPRDKKERKHYIKH